MGRSYLLLCAVLGACAEGKSDIGGADAGRLIDAGPRPDAGPEVDGGPIAGTPVTLTQSTSTTITDENSVLCFSDEHGFIAEASYFRVFDLASEGITTPLAVTQVSFGVEDAIGAGGNQAVQVKIHALTGMLTNANLMAPVGTASIIVSDNQSGTVVVTPVTGTIPVGSKLVVELHVPDGAEGNEELSIGSNTAGEDGPTYVRDGCGGAEEPTPLANLLEEGEAMHWVLSVDGTR